MTEAEIIQQAKEEMVKVAAAGIEEIAKCCQEITTLRAEVERLKEKVEVHRKRASDLWRGVERLKGQNRELREHPAVKIDTEEAARLRAERDEARESLAEAKVEVGTGEKIRESLQENARLALKTIDVAIARADKAEKQVDILFGSHAFARKQLATAQALTLEAAGVIRSLASLPEADWPGGDAFLAKLKRTHPESIGRPLPDPRDCEECKGSQGSLTLVDGLWRCDLCLEDREGGPDRRVGQPHVSL